MIHRVQIQNMGTRYLQSNFTTEMSAHLILLLSLVKHNKGLFQLGPKKAYWPELSVLTLKPVFIAFSIPNGKNYSPKRELRHFIITSLVMDHNSCTRMKKGSSKNLDIVVYAFMVH